MSLFAKRLRAQILAELRGGDKTALDLIEATGVTNCTLQTQLKALRKLDCVIVAGKRLVGQHRPLFVYGFKQYPPELPDEPDLETGRIRHPTFDALERQWAHPVSPPKAGTPRAVRLIQLDQVEV